MVFPSPGYSIAGLAYLLDGLDCKIILAPSSTPNIVPAFLAVRPLKLLNVQEVEGLLTEDHPHFPFDKCFETARHEPLVVLHTSGTTSHPKPILWTHDFAASFIQHNQWAPPPGEESVDKLYRGNRVIPILPVFHVRRHSF